MRDVLRKRHDTVMQYVCVKPPTSGFVPPFSFLDAIDRCSEKAAVFSYLTVSVYILPSRSHTNTSERSGGGSFEKKKVDVESSSSPMLLPFERSSLSCGKETARYVIELWLIHLRENASSHERAR